MEGSVWESILFIAARSINNLIVLIDNNNLQSATSNFRYSSKFNTNTKKNFDLSDGTVILAMDIMKKRLKEKFC